MQKFFIYSYKYNIDIGKLLKRRLKQYNLELASEFSKSTINLELENDKRNAFIDSVCDLLLYDVMQLKIADIVNCLDLGIEHKRNILVASVYYATKAAIRSTVRNALEEYFESENLLNIDGYITFRMPQTMSIWESCVKKATNEYEDILRLNEISILINELFGLYENTEKMTLIMRNDGSCTVTDSNNSKIEYPANSYDSMMSILLSTNPAEIKVYNPTKNDEEFLKGLSAVFPERVHVLNNIID